MEKVNFDSINNQTQPKKHAKSSQILTLYLKSARKNASETLFPDAHMSQFFHMGWRQCVYR